MKGILISLILASSAVFAQQVVAPDIVESIGATKNFIINPSAVKNTRGTAVSSAVLTRDTDTADRIDGVASFNCDTSALNGFCRHDTATITVPATTGNCEASAVIKGDASLYSFRVTDGTDTLVDRALGNFADWTQVTVNYPCGATRDIRLVQTTAGTSPAINYGKLYWGAARNIGTVAQATFVGGMEQAGASGCEYLENTSTGLTNFVSLGTGTGCNAWTVTSNGPGVISAIGNNDHRLTYTNMPAGNYQVIIQGQVRSSVGGTCYFRLSDGTNTFQPQAVASAANEPSVTVLVFSPTYSSTGTRTFTVQASDNHSGTCTLANANSGLNLSWKIYRFPTTEEQVLRHDQVAWRVDANIGGANPSLGTGNVSSYTEITNGSLDLVNNSGPGVIPAQIPCSGTNPPTGLTCSAGNESVGVSFNLPAAGDVRACVSFAHAAGAPSGSDINAVFQLVETPNNAQTILQEGKVRVQSGSGTLGANLTRALRVCGNFSFTSAGQKTIRLMYEQAILGSPTDSFISADRNTSFGQRDIHWEVYPLNTYQPAPLLVGSVISGSSGIERVVRARIAACSASPCTIQAQTGQITSVTRASAGDYTINFASGTFSDLPACFVSAQRSSTSLPIIAIIPTSSSVVGVEAGTDAGIKNDFTTIWSIMCIGPR